MIVHMDKKTFSKILGKSPADFVRALAKPVTEAYPVRVIRPPMKTMVMIRMQETVAKTNFYLGEMLACEAMVEVAGQKGFALIAGDDMDKVLAAAVLDAICKTDLPETKAIRSALEKQRQVLLEAEQQEIRQHASSQVQFNTLDVSY